MKTKIFSISAVFLLTVLLFSCGTNTDQNNIIDLNPIRTEAVATFASSLTKTAVAIPTLSPTPTIEPTLTLTPIVASAVASPTKNPCYNLLWIKDVTIPDGTVMKPGEAFTKTWLVQNNGDCAWAPGFTFSNVGGDPMRGATVKLSKPIPVGLKYEISVDLIAPSGIYGLIQSTWSMAYEPGMYFGDPPTVNIVVEDPNQPTATVAP